MVWMKPERVWLIGTPIVTRANGGDAYGLFCRVASRRRCVALLDRHA